VCPIRLKLLTALHKTLATYAYETPETLETYIRLQHACIQHRDLVLQHSDEHLKYMSETPETLEIYACNMKHTVATCVYSHATYATSR
jgi:hypothetical protein